MSYKILFSNIGYAKGIDGSWGQHMRGAHRHLYCPVPLQHEVLGQVKAMVMQNQPDLCCFVEMDRGSFASRRVNHLDLLADGEYIHSDIACKYGGERWFQFLPFFWGKSNGYMAKTMLEHKHHYFTRGTKRLMHEVRLPSGVTLFFGHFALQYSTRQKQFAELNKRLSEATGEMIVLADFNILHGFRELADLTRGSGLRLMNDPDIPTFMFGGRRMALDLCLCSPALAERARLDIVPQPYSDHAALLLEIKDAE